MRNAPPSWREREGYLERGRAARAAIERMLPADWAWPGKTVLDFGCGTGRAVRHLAAEAPECELWGSDIDAACIEWDSAHLSPPVTFVVNDELPPLPFPDGKFDLVYALSVFTHISDAWAAWLLEMDRILAPGGRLVATFMGEGMSEAVSGEPWNQALVGMNVHLPGQGWDLGGPMVLHSPWWIEEHWGRLFEVERLVPLGFIDYAAATGQDDHGAAALRKREGPAPTREKIERIDPEDRREARALDHQVRRLRAENVAISAELRRLPAADERAPISGREGVRAVWAAFRRRLGRG
jgi:SAM-dependent methyltransferase